MSTVNLVNLLTQTKASKHKIMYKVYEEVDILNMYGGKMLTLRHNINSVFPRLHVQYKQFEG